jgi:hypothetical protein
MVTLWVKIVTLAVTVRMKLTIRKGRQHIPRLGTAYLAV